MKYIKIIFTLLLFIMFTGCMDMSKPPKNINPSKKAFEQEDAYILFALRAEELKDYESASKLFEMLWEKSMKKEYLYKSLEDMLLTRKYKSVTKKTDIFLKEFPNDTKLMRIKVFSLVGEKKLQDARNLSLKLVEKTQKSSDYILVADIYIKQNKPQEALEYLQNVYLKDYNEDILDKISLIMYINLHRKKEAIAYLKKHTRVNGCSEHICKRLISFYSDQNDIDGLLSVYLKYYDIKKSDEIAKRVIQIYNYKKEYIKLMQFLEKTGSADDILLQIYINFKNYNKAYKLAQKLYENSGDMDYLGQSAIFEYESHKNKNDKKMQQNVVKKLEEVVKYEKTPLYLNYLGYLLIDHSIDIKKGMEYVREALKINGDSSYYLDSLAWGHYRLGECKKAYKLIKKASSLEGGDDPEVKEHIKMIKKCLKTKKGDL